ncbi:hypothetical protein ACOSQ4_009472 [Xanthoceras sorbifolium]
MWSKLERVYSQQSLVKILQLRQQLQNIKKGSDSIYNFVLKIKNIGDSLMVAGEEVMEPCNVIGVLINNFRDLFLQILKYVDSGATNHITIGLNNLSLKSEYQGNNKLIVGDGSRLVIFDIDDSKVASHTMPTHQEKLNHILHVPSITNNLLSISKITKDNDALAVFDLGTPGATQLQSHICYKHLSHNVVHNASNVIANSCNNRDTRLYSTDEPCNVFSAVLAAKNNQAIWHAKLGHPAPIILQKVLHALHFPYNVNAPSFCDSCKLGKLHKLPFTRSEIRATSPLQLIDMIGLEIENEEQLKEYQKNKRKMRHENRLKQCWKTVMDTGLKNNRPANLITLNNTQPHNKGKLEDAVKEEEEEEEKNKKKEPEVSNHISLITLFMGSEKSQTAMARKIMSNEKLKEHYNNKIEELKMKIEVEKMDPAVKTRMEKRIQRWETMKKTWDTMRSSTDPKPQAMSVSEEEKK